MAKICYIALGRLPTAVDEEPRSLKRDNTISKPSYLRLRAYPFLFNDEW